MDTELLNHLDDLFTAVFVAIVVWLMANIPAMRGLKEHRPMYETLCVYILGYAILDLLMYATFGW